MSRKGKENSKKKKPAQQRYTNEGRWKKNKRRKAKKEAKRTNTNVKIKIDNEWETITP